MTDEGHAAVELALAAGALLLPVALVVFSFGPWLERRVIAEAAAAEAARAAVLELDQAVGATVALGIISGHGLTPDLVRLGWCGAEPSFVEAAAGACPFIRGAVVRAEVEVWAPLVTTPWGEVGGIWVGSSHSELIDLYRSLS